MNKKNPPEKSPPAKGGIRDTTATNMGKGVQIVGAKMTTLEDKAKMKCACCGREAQLSHVTIIDSASPRTATPRNVEGDLCPDCEMKVHNPALQDRQFEDWLADAWRGAQP